MATLTQPTLDRLVKEVRLLLNQTKATNSFWSDEELGNYINDGVRKYYLEVVQHAEGQFTTQTDLNIVQGSETIALPSDFFKAKNVYKKTDTGFTILRYWNNLTMSYNNPSDSNSDLYLPYYFFRGNNLVLRPTPNFSETAGIRIEYIAFPEQMILGTDVMTTGISPVFKELIVMYCVYKAKVKESLVTGTDTSAIAAGLLQDTLTAFKESVGNRSNSPQFIIPFNPESN